MEDEEILALYFARSERAIAETETKYGWYCKGVAYRILASFDDTQECVNDTWLKAWNAIPPAKPENLQAFLGKITRNGALHRLRASKARKRGGTSVSLALSELGECVSDGETPETAFLRRELSESLNRFLGKLSKEKRVIFVLRYWYLYSIKEIAQKMGMRENTVSSTLFRLRKQLKIHLEQEGVLL